MRISDLFYYFFVVLFVSQPSRSQQPSSKPSLEVGKQTSEPTYAPTQKTSSKPSLDASGHALELTNSTTQQRTNRNNIQQNSTYINSLTIVSKKNLKLPI